MIVLYVNEACTERLHSLVCVGYELSRGVVLTVVVIVFQSLVELFGMAAYIWWVPKKLYPSAI